MIQPERDTLQAIALLKSHNPLIYNWLREWHKLELNRLPVVLVNTGVAQGRCQVLSDILNIIENPTPTVAKPRRDATPNAYR